MTDTAFIADYFSGEKIEALLFMLVGVAAIALAAWLVRQHSTLRGMAIPLVAVALIQLAVGGTVSSRSDAQCAQLQQLARQDPAEFKRVESPRMKTVIANFALYRQIEIGLLALGMAIVVLLRNREYWFAVGLGLVLQAGLMLALDFFAEARAGRYFRAVVGA
jgi:hypothetical protein